jgi:hypothetical protein
MLRRNPDVPGATEGNNRQRIGVPYIRDRSCDASVKFPQTPTYIIVGVKTFTSAFVYTSVLV